MKIIRRVGATSQILQVFIQDSSSTVGAGLTGLVFNSSGLTAYYHRDTDTTPTAISLVTMTVGTFTSSGFKEIDSTNMPGWYQFCPPNAALASGASSVGIHLKGVTNMAPQPIEIDLDSQVDVYLWNGTAVASPATAGIPEVDVKNINNVAASSVTTINANIGMTQPINFTGTAGSALVKSDTVDIAGAAVSASTAQLGVNVVNVGGSASKGAAGYVGIDWAQIANPTTTENLSGTTINTVTGQLTAAQIATGVWQDATSGDFTTASSIGKALYIANVAPGGSGGHLISGSNAGTTTLGALTVTGTTTMSDGLTITRSSANSTALNVTGTGTGSGAVFASGAGATGDAVKLIASSTNGAGMTISGAGTGNGLTINGGGGATGDAVQFIASSTNGAGLTVTGKGTGNGATFTSGGGATGNGLSAVAASTNGNGFNGLGTGTANGMLLTGGNGANGDGLHVVGGSGASSGIRAIGGGTSGDGMTLTAAAASGASPGGNGLTAVGGAASTTGGGVAGLAFALTGGAGAATTNGAGAGLKTIGGGTTTVSGNDGLIATGTGNGNGFTLTHAGSGLDLNAQTTNNLQVDVRQVLGTASKGAAGYVGTDQAQIANPTSSVDLSGTKISGTDNPVAITSNVKKNQALNGFSFVMTSSSTHAPQTGLTVTATRSLDGATFAGCANAVTEIANGWYTINLANTDLNANNVALRFTATSADDRDINLVTQP